MQMATSHVRVRVGGSGQQQAEKLVLGIRRHRPGGAKAIELDPLGRGHGRYGALQGLRIELLAHLDEGVQGGVEYFQAIVGDRVVFVNRELAETGAGGEALRQFQLEILKTAAADRPAETHDGGLADTDLVSQVGHRAVHDGGGVEQHAVRNLQLRLAQQVAGQGNVLQEVQGQDSI
jgi:hypothetical protein